MNCAAISAGVLATVTSTFLAAPMALIAATPDAVGSAAGSPAVTTSSLYAGGGGGGGGGGAEVVEVAVAVAEGWRWRRRWRRRGGGGGGVPTVRRREALQLCSLDSCTVSPPSAHAMTRKVCRLGGNAARSSASVIVCVAFLHRGFVARLARSVSPAERLPSLEAKNQVSLAAAQAFPWLATVAVAWAGDTVAVTAAT